jgi:hypothetical protein
MSTPYTHLFSYGPHPNFATFRLSDFIRAPLFTNQLGSSYHHKYIAELDDLFNCVYTHLAQSKINYDLSGFVSHFKMFLLANVWSDPHVLLSITSFALPPSVDFKTGVTTQSAVSAWYYWLSKTKLVLSSDLKRGMDGFLTQRQTALGSYNGNTLAKLEDLKCTIHTKTLPLEVDSALTKMPAFKTLREMYEQYAANVLDATGLESAASKLFADANLKYGWYFERDSKKPCTIHERLVSDVLIRRTYDFDQYSGAPRRRISIESEKLVDRFNVAVQLLGSFERGKVRQGKHIQDYVSFWNRANYLVRLFDFGMERRQFTSKQDPNHVNAQEASWFYLLLSMCGCLSRAWLKHFSDVLDQVDSISSVPGRAKLEYAWVMLHGALEISTVNPAVRITSMNRDDYGNLLHIIEVISRWGWNAWFCVKETSTRGFVSSLQDRVGSSIQYVPVPRFNTALQIFLEDQFNAQGISKLLKQFTDTHNDDDTFGISYTLLKIEKNNKSRKPSPYVFKTNESTQVVRDAMVRIYSQMQTISYLLADVIHLVSYELSGPLQPTALQPKIATVLELATTVHLPPKYSQGGLYPNQTLKNALLDVDKSIQKLSSLNNITPKAELTRIPKSTMRLSSTRLYDIVADILQRSRATSQSSLFPELKTSLDEIKTNWESSVASEFVECYVALSYFFIILRNLCASVDQLWTSIFSNIQKSLGLGRNTARLGKALPELNRLMQGILLYLRDLDVVTAGSTGTKEYSDSLGVSGQVVDQLPYIQRM